MKQNQLNLGCTNDVPGMVPPSVLMAYGVKTQHTQPTCAVPTVCYPLTLHSKLLPSVSCLHCLTASYCQCNKHGTGLNKSDSFPSTDVNASSLNSLGQYGCMPASPLAHHLTAVTLPLTPQQESELMSHGMNWRCVCQP